MLLKEEDLQSLPDVVANMDTEENKAETILTKVCLLFRSYFSVSFSLLAPRSPPSPLP